MEHSILTGVIILLATSVILLAIFEHFKLPILIAYLLVGVVLGPSGLVWIPHTDDLHSLAEFGVVLLLFTIGLEFSLSRLWMLRKHVFGLGGAQVLVMAFIGGLIALSVGLPMDAAFIIGGALALSSTAVVSRELSRRDELGKQHGRLAVPILIFQDLAVVPFLILIPVLASDSIDILSETGKALLTGIVVIAFMVIAGRWILRPLFRRITDKGSEELFTLTTLLFALAAAWITEFSGLSLALGAFLAGVMLSETEYRHRLINEIRPFRDVLLGFFFIVIGMMLDLAAVKSLFPWMILTVLILILVKTLVTTLLARFFSVPRQVAFHTAFILSQAGEFGLVLVMLATSQDVLSKSVEQLVLGVIIISIALTPLLIISADSVAKIICLRQNAIND